MPVDPHNYHPRWDAIAAAVKRRAGWRCVRCGAPHSRETVLTVHHADGDPSNNRRSNLLALCAPCHLADHRRAKRYGYCKDQMEIEL